MSRRTLARPTMRARRWLAGRDAWAPALVALLGLTAAARALYRARLPVNWDAVQYALALRRFDVAAHQPHPPGNPLYVLLGRAAARLVPDPNAALVLVSAGASLALVWATALVGARLGGRALGLWAALLVAVNPLAWFYGEVALSYAPEAAAGAVLALLAWEARACPRAGVAAALGAALAFVGGLRPTALPLLAPLALYGALRLRWRDRCLAGGVALVGCLAWLVPLLALSGGPAAYWEQLQRLTAVAVAPTSLLGGPSRRWLANLAELVAAIVVALNLLGPLSLAAARRARPRRDETTFLLVWSLPALATFALVHFGQWGYLLLPLPALLLLALLPLACAWPTRADAWLAAAALCGAALFAATPLLPLGGAFQPTAAAIRAHDAAWRSAAAVVSQLPPDETLVLAAADGHQGFRLASYLLPAYRVVGVGWDARGDWGPLYEARGGESDYRLDPDLRVQPTIGDAGVHYVVLLDRSLARAVVDPVDWTRITLADGTPLLIGQLQAGGEVAFRGRAIALVPRATIGREAPGTPAQR